jgi:hypothetical protein
VLKELIPEVKGGARKGVDIGAIMTSSARKRRLLHSYSSEKPSLSKQVYQELSTEKKDIPIFSVMKF